MSSVHGTGPRSASRSAGTRVKLLDSFELVCDGTTLRLPMSAQRVVVFVALHSRPVQRSYVAGSLWLDSCEERAQANLRSALWRIHRCNQRLVEVRGQQLALGSDVAVDLRQVQELAQRVLHDCTSHDVDVDASALAGDLLPDWYEDWVMFERERFRQLRLAALDVLCERLTRAGRLRDALDVGLAAVAGEPLRESAHRAVIRVHLTEGNVAEAIRQHRLCRRLLRERLGIEPSARMRELMRDVDMANTVR